MLRLEDMLQSLEVHLVEAVSRAPQLVVDHHAVVARNEHPERVIYRLLNHHLVAGFGKMVQHQAEAVHDAADEAGLVGSEFQAVALALPVDDGLPVVLERNAVAVDGMPRDAVGKRLCDVGTNSSPRVPGLKVRVLAVMLLCLI